MKSLLFPIGYLFCLAAIALAADDSLAETGKKAETTDCVACHSLRLIHSQRLSAAAWGKELDKMIGWGAPAKDRQLLIDYLSTEYSNANPVPTPATSANGVNH
jgi:mono/diheme cytochrome c family protein